MPKLTDDCIDKLNHSIPLTDYLTPSPKYRNEFGCPFCGSTHHVKVFTKNNIGSCIKCQDQATKDGKEYKGFNLIQAVEQVEGLDFLDACKAIHDRTGTPLEYDTDISQNDRAGLAKMKAHAKDSGSSPLTKPEPAAESAETVADGPESVDTENASGKNKKLIERALKDVDKARDYLHSRGLSDHTIDKYKIGYLDRVYFAKAGKELPAVIFPYNTEFTYYEARSIDGKYFYKPATGENEREPIYNPAALEKDDPCFVCESIIDALSIIDVGGNAVALNGTAYENNLIKAINFERDDRETDVPTLILSLDNDDETQDFHGQKAQKALSGKLDAMGVDYICANYTLDAYDPNKDANDFLQSNREQFKTDIENNIAIASDETGIDAFLLSVSTEKFKPIPTGIKKIDDILHGGFIPQTQILIGGAPGTGKTIFASMLFESIARQGRKCLYINYEMAKEQLFARSISRRIADIIDQNQYKITALDVLQNYRNSEQTQKIIKDAAGWYKREIAPNLILNPFTKTDVDDLLKYLEAVADTAEENGEPVPLICIDYLHLLTGDPGEDPASVLKRALTALKRFAIKYNTVVIGIQAQNREANKKKTSSLEAGRDTSNLEYGADIVFQLVKKDPENSPNIVHICITKSRFTETKNNGIPYELQGESSRLVYQGFTKH